MNQSLMDHLHQFSAERWSGEVEVSSSQGMIHLLLHEGNLIWAHRSVERSLERWEKIPWIQLPPREVLNTCKTWDTLVATVLKANTQSYEDFTKYLKIDRLELFFRMFFWTNVELIPRSFTLAHPPVELSFLKPKSLEMLLKEALARLEEWPRLQRKIGSGKRIFVTTFPMQRNKSDAIDKSLAVFGESSKAYQNYSHEEQEILELCDGRNTVSDIVRLSLEGEFLTLRRLAHLWDRSSIRPKESDAISSINVLPTTPITGRDIAAAGILLIFSFIAFLLLHLLSYPAYDDGRMSEKLLSSLEIFRLKESRYPSTLHELKELGFAVDFDDFPVNYSLIHPEKYRLQWKSGVERMRP